jgi:isopenicillin N synthase-like dioxygenase
MALPIIDVSPLVTGRGDLELVARAIRAACEDVGFFYAAGHGIPERLISELDQTARKFFALPVERKQAVAMELGGRAWRGFFPVGREMTSGEPDRKEGIYFGAELGPEDPRVRANLPLHGANLWPVEVPELRAAVLGYLACMTELGHAIMRGVSASLSLPVDWFRSHYTADPILLFRIFHYPPDDRASKGSAFSGWGVGEHTDYGLLTLLLQDDVDGLEVKTRAGWLAVPPIAGTLVCNVGDMLDRITRGRYRSTPHRVANRSSVSRLSYAFFFDPAWSADLVPIPSSDRPIDDRSERWDGASVHDFAGTYGDYLVTKVSRVFPELARVLSLSR